MKKILAILILISINLYSITENEEKFLNASMNNNIRKVKELLTLGVNINIQDVYGNTTLMYASKDGYIEIVRELLEAGTDVNIQNKFGNTALMLACVEHSGHTGVVRELIKAGADINIKNKNGDTALDYAENIRGSSKNDIIELLLGNSN